MTKDYTEYTNHTKEIGALGSVMGATLFGAIVGGTGAAAKGIRAIKKGKATREDVAMDVAREAGSTAVAAGTASAVVRAFSLGPFLSTLGIVAVATGTKYAMDNLLKPEPVVAPVAVATDSPVVAKKAVSKKVAPKKTTTKKPTAQKTAATPKKTTAKKTGAKASTSKTSSKKTVVRKTKTKTDKSVAQ